MRSEAVKNNSARTNIQLVEGSAGWLECGSGGPGGLQTPGHISFVDPNRYTQKSDESLEKDLCGTGLREGGSSQYCVCVGGYVIPCLSPLRNHRFDLPRDGQ